jgi:hypothetical protein
MPTQRYQHQAWVEKQLRTLVDIGVDLAEAERAIRWILDNLPPGADPATWIPAPHELWIEPGSVAAVEDAREDWIASAAVQARFKRLLDAKIEEKQL